MSTQYWIGGFFIDLSRNQITQNNQTQTLAPKALAVLTYLAENRGQVVSQDALLTKVWQDTAVSPNTLQKSIAQLRKALGDEGSVYIKTHAKQGYSLECDVRWQEACFGADPERDSVSESESILETSSDSSANSSRGANKQSASQYPLGIIALTVAILILGFVGFNTFKQYQQSPTLAFGQMRAVTSSDNKEIASVYSPDGRYVVFHRYSDENCINNIWAKDLETKQEIQLTQKLDTYGRHSFSKDGKQLVFIRTVECEQPINQKLCYQLVSLDFHKALEAPQAVRVLLECKNSEISRPKWLNNNNIAMLQRTSDRWQLISYSIDENKSQVIHAINDGNIVYFDYSPERDLIALTSVHGDGKYYIEMIAPDGQVVSSNPIQFPKEIPGFRGIYPNFSSIDNLLIFSTGRQLFTLSTQGQISNISLPLDEPMGTPVFHPNGNQMLAIKGYYDSDIVSIPIALNSDQVQSSQDESNQGQSNQNESSKTETKNDGLPSSLNHAVLHRSIASDDTAKFQPNGNLLAFISARSGEEQVWIADEQGVQQLTNFPMDSNLNGMVWAADGQSVLVNTYRELKQVNLDGTENIISLGGPIRQLYDWDSEQQRALASVLINGVFRLAEINLTNNELRVVNEKRVKWAGYSKEGKENKEGEIIFTDHMDRFWRTGAIEDQLIAGLVDHGSELDFLIKEGLLYGVNEDFQFWSFSLAESELNLLGEASKKLDGISDIKNGKILASLRVNSRKEVAELFLKK